MKKIFLFFSIITVLCSTACSSFILDEDVEKLKIYESADGVYQDYILLQDIERYDMTFEKGERVRLIIVTSDEWIKVYAYKSDEDLLKSIRFLVLHMFNDDFPGEKFDRAKFDAELGKIVQKAGSADTGTKPDEKNKKKVKATKNKRDSK